MDTPSPHPGAPLKTLFLSHRGKVADKWESYLDIYESEFTKYRFTSYPILEIGVQNCGSLEIWAKYFSNSRRIIGVDIIEKLDTLRFDDDRIALRISHSSDLHIDYCKSFEPPIIIIDDASHQSLDIINTFMTMFHLLKDGGTYVVEDLCCAYWSEFNDGVTVSSISFFKFLVDIVNFEHWGRQDRVQKFLLSLNLDAIRFCAILESIKSIKFYNSMCFIEKHERGFRNFIGKRVVVGDEFALGFRAKHGSQVTDLNFSRRDFQFDDSDLR